MGKKIHHPKMSKERLQKALAHAGIASRRKVEQMIDLGMISVNGICIRKQGVVIDTEIDNVSYNGRHVSIAADELSERVYLLINKPAGVLSTTKDNTDRKTVIDLIRCLNGARVYPIGRLDYNAEGVLLLTNDGALTNKLIHPKYHVKKIYEVKIKGIPTEDQLNKLRRGIYLEDGPTGPCEIEFIKKVKANTWVRVVLTKGKNRQIKRMFWRIEHPVQRIIRTHFANIALGDLRPGEFRNLSQKEIKSLKDSAALPTEMG